AQGIELPSLYFAHRRDVFRRDGTLLALSPYLPLLPGERVENRLVRFRTIGDMTCTGAVESSATTVAEVIAELAASRTTERGTRADDRRSETAMEDRKRQGYF
ncbi:MAG: sulfate adenylyltransferase small subunit, partial [Anaerolineae bacterium]